MGIFALDGGEIIPSYMSQIERNGGGSGTLSQRNPTKSPKVRARSAALRWIFVFVVLKKNQGSDGFRTVFICLNRFLFRSRFWMGND